MTTQEFSDSFDVLLNSYAREASFGEPATTSTITLDEYEKSILLTESQEDLVKELYSGRNSTGESFENSEELRRYLSDLIDTASITVNSALPDETLYEHYPSLSNSKVFQLPSNILFITYEAIKLGSFPECFSGTTIKVVPTTQDELANVLENPFRGPSKRRALRLDLANNKVEIVSMYPIDKYIVRYIAKLSPIILEDLPDDLSINGVSSKTECNLNPALHQVILERAVRKALLTRGTTNENTGSK